MEIKPLDFLIGLSLGLALGAGGTVLVSRIRGWLGYSETGRLRAENRVLARRLAERLGKKSLNELSDKSDETLTTDH